MPLRDWLFRINDFTCLLLFPCLRKFQRNILRVKGDPLERFDIHCNGAALFCSCSFLSDTKTDLECGITERCLKNKG